MTGRQNTALGHREYPHSAVPFGWEALSPHDGTPSRSCLILSPLWHRSHHFPPCLLSSHTGLCAGRNALPLEVGMAGSFLSCWSQPEEHFEELPDYQGGLKDPSFLPAVISHLPFSLFQ